MGTGARGWVQIRAVTSGAPGRKFRGPQPDLGRGEVPKEILENEQSRSPQWQWGLGPRAAPGTCLVVLCPKLSSGKLMMSRVRARGRRARVASRVSRGVLYPGGGQRLQCTEAFRSVPMAGIHARCWGAGGRVHGGPGLRCSVPTPNHPLRPPPQAQLVPALPLRRHPATVAGRLQAVAADTSRFVRHVQDSGGLCSPLHSGLLPAATRWLPEGTHRCGFSRGAGCRINHSPHTACLGKMCAQCSVKLGQEGKAQRRQGVPEGRLGRGSCARVALWGPQCREHGHKVLLALLWRESRDSCSPLRKGSASKNYK